MAGTILIFWGYSLRSKFMKDSSILPYYPFNKKKLTNFIWSISIIIIKFFVLHNLPKWTEIIIRQTFQKEVTLICQIYLILNASPRLLTISFTIFRFHTHIHLLQTQLNCAYIPFDIMTNMQFLISSLP